MITAKEALKMFLESKLTFATTEWPKISHTLETKIQEAAKAGCRELETYLHFSEEFIPDAVKELKRLGYKVRQPYFSKRNIVISW